LWSPWRSDYVSSADEHNADTCFLCAASNSEVFTSNNLLVARTGQVVVLLNRYPYNAGHLLVAPRAHLDSLAHLAPDVAAELMHVVQWSLRVVESVLQPHAVNIGANLGRASGAGVPDHLHMHIVPRWSGDTNFMPVLAEVKVVSESLTNMWDQFREAFAKNPRA
jgi:ATP adenylyltransferase